MGEGWRDSAARALGKVSGALVVVVFRKKGNRWSSGGWVEPRLAPHLESFEIPTIQEDHPLLAEARRKRVCVAAPLAILAGAPDALVGELRGGALLELGRDCREVAWLGLPDEPALDRLEAVVGLVDEVSSPGPARVFQLFSQGMPVLFIAADRDGMIQHCSQHIEHMGYDVDELPGTPASSLFGAGEWERLQLELRRSREVKRFRALICHRSGVLMAREVTAILTADAEWAWTMILVSDLRQDRQIGHFRRLEAVERLVSGVSHELNNPLQTVVGSAEMLAGMKLTDAAHRRAQRVLSGARRCQEVVNGLLKLKRKRHALAAPVDMDELVRRSLKRALAEFDPLKISHRIDVALNLPTVKGNAVDLQQALDHVMNNAFQAVLRETEPELAISIRGVGEMVEISIKDNGPGFTPEDADRAFEPFFTTRGVGAGKGLGLSIALGIVQEHGGSMELLSDDAGARVFLTIPVEGYKPF